MRAIALSSLFFISLPLAAAPVELGTVKWSRNYDAALKTVEDSGKPMFLLFQEVPG